MHRFLLVTIFLLASAMPAAPQTLHVSLRQDLDVLDPTLTTSYVARIVLAGLCDKLFDIDEKLHVVPQLATAYEWADDRTMIVHLRSGVKFQDGETLDAEAVKYSLQRHLTLQGSFRKSEISSIDHVEVIDPATVRILLKNPSGAFLAQLTDRSGMIYPPQATKAAGKDFASHPVCSGPFSFVDRVAQDHVTLARFPGYWDARDIHFDTGVYQVFPDNSVRLANLRAGTTDLTEYLVPTDVATVRADPRLKLAISDALGYIGLVNNLGLEASFGHSLRQECSGSRGPGRGDRPKGAGRCSIQRHVRAKCAAGCSGLAVLRRGAVPAVARSCKSQGAVAAGWRDTAGDTRAVDSEPARHKAGGRGYSVDGSGSWI